VGSKSPRLLPWNLDGRGDVMVYVNRRSLKKDMAAVSIRRWFVAGLVALTSCSSGARSVQQTTTPTTSPSIAPSPSPSLPTLVVSRRLGQPPGDCGGPAPRPTTVSKEFAPLVGKTPLWAGFYAELDRSKRTYSAHDAPRTEKGWRIKVLWVMKPGNRSIVRVRGANTATGEPTWFAVDGEDADAVMEAVMDPATPSVEGEGGFNEFTSYVYFPRAGCYRLTAESDAATWSLGFGFGR
jgi:hypothetical protein